MGFVARKGGEVINWNTKEHDGKEECHTGGIRQGDEILNHYCDVELPVKERREVRLLAILVPVLGAGQSSIIVR